MRLISCYIENFGAITREEIKFGTNFTSVCRENGFGKTTLASFLEAMFYGMDSDRANSKEFGMRRRFNPFGGGKFGGSVVFSVGKDSYRIERYFDEKSEAKDSLTVYKNGEQYSAFGDRIGEKIFGIDKQSFERTIFIDAHEIEIGSTGSINAKLNNFVEGSTDDTNTEKALERLEKVAKEYKKAKSGNDLISKERASLLETERKISNAESIKASLPEKYARLSEYEAAQKGLRQKLYARQKAELELKDWEQYDNFMSYARQAKQTAEELSRKYPAGIPSERELSAVRQHISAKTALGQQSARLLSQEDTETLSALQNKYAGGIPSEGEIADIRNKITALTNEEAAIRSEESIKPAEYEISLRKKFGDNMPTERTLAQIDGAAAEYERAKREYDSTPDYISERSGGPQKKSSVSKKAYVILAVLAAIVAVAGIAVLFVQMTAGIILLAAGAVCLIAVGFVYLNKKASAPAADSVQKINPEKAAKQRIKNGAELAVQKLLAPYGYDSDADVMYSVSKFKDDFANYKKLFQSYRERAERLAQKKALCAGLGKELSDYFAAYGFAAGDFSRRLSDMLDEINQYKTLAGTRDKLNRQNADTNNMLAVHERAIGDFCAKYHLTRQSVENIGGLEADVAKYARAESEHAENIKKAMLLKEEKQLADRPAAADDEEAVKEEIANLNKDITALSLEISDCETEAEKLDDLYAEKQRHEELLNKYRHDYDLLTRTAELLKEADKRLKDRYIAPIKNNFVRYASLLEEALGEKVTMTPNFEVRYEHNGIERSEKHLSAGQRSICAFCFRMALIENMYTEEKPFLILDDPFVNLDQKHMNRVKEILKKLSERLQLIYFTCHESRAI